MAEHGREGRFPYLDEDVMALLRALPTQLVRLLDLSARGSFIRVSQHQPTH